jgi:RNA polymerase sigma-70 factor (ECF subfamily)
MEKTSTTTDQQLIQRFIDGESHAMEMLVNRHKDRIFTSIYLMVKDKYLAEDIFQDLFIRIIETIREGKYKEENKFLYWAMRISHNLCIDHFRKVGGKPVIKTSDGNDIFEVINFSDPNAEENIIQAQTKDRIMKLVSQLPQEQKEIIILRHFANMKFQEISKVLDCSVNTSLGRMRYAILNLRKMIDEKQIAL